MPTIWLGNACCKSAHTTQPKTCMCLLLPLLPLGQTPSPLATALLADMGMELGGSNFQLFYFNRVISAQQIVCMLQLTMGKNSVHVQSPPLLRVCLQFAQRGPICMLNKCTEMGLSHGDNEVTDSSEKLASKSNRKVTGKASDTSAQISF